MHIASLALIGLVAVEHLYFLVLEMFLWTKPAGLRAFGNTQAKANDTAVLAKNQGLYNGFLAAGLLWSIAATEPREALHLRLFFLGCVVVAGIYGGVTVARKILFLQALPAALAIALVLLAGAMA
jgi:putative membrane protein